MKKWDWENVFPAVPTAVHNQLEQALAKKKAQRSPAPKPLRPLAALALALAALLALSGVAYAASQLGLWDYLIKAQSPAPALQEMAQDIVATTVYDDIQIDVTGAVYDGIRLSVSFSAKNLKPENLAMIHLSTLRLNGKSVSFSFQSLSEQWLPDIFSVNEAGAYSRNPVQGGMLSLPLDQEYTGEILCEAVFTLSRPTNGMPLVCDPILWYDYAKAFPDSPEMAADYQKRQSAIEQSGIAMLDAWESLHPEYALYLSQGYTLLDASGQFLLDDPACQELLEQFVPEAYGVQMNSNAMLNREGQMTEPETFTLAFTINADQGKANRIVCVPEDTALSNCTVHFTQAVVSPLSTVISFEISPSQQTAQAAQEILQSFGPVSLVDENGQPLDFYDMEYETGWGLTADSGPLVMDMMEPGLRTLPKEIHFQFEDSEEELSSAQIAWRREFEERVYISLGQ